MGSTMRATSREMTKSHYGRLVPVLVLSFVSMKAKLAELERSRP